MRFYRLKRREFITLLGGATVWPLAVRAQQAGRTYRLGVLHNQGPQSLQFPPFYDELRRLGFVEGQNLIVDSRGYAVRTEQFPAVAAELVKAQVDAIVAGGAAAARAAQVATRTIPIFTLTDDMVGQGLAASLARPGGNTTGISIFATELDGKRQEILMEMVPATRRMAVLADANTAAPQNMRALQEAAHARGVELAVHLVERPERIVPEIEEARRAGAEALNVLASPILYARRLDIFERTAALRLPAIYQSPEFAEEGGMSGYGPRITQMFRQLAATSGRGSGVVGYNVQVAVDTEHHLIVTHEVTNTGTDRSQLAKMALQAKNVLHADHLDAVADRGYFNGTEILACEQADIMVTLPKPMTSGAKSDGRFGKQDFVYLATEDVYRCPAGEKLTYRYTNEEDGKTLRRYWTTACPHCPLKSQCTTAPQRRITRWEHEHVLEAVQQRLDENPQAMRQRRETVEHPFGTLKMRMGATHFLMKRLPKVATEMALHVLAYNLTRVMNIIGVQPLLAVMRA